MTWWWVELDAFDIACCYIFAQTGKKIKGNFCNAVHSSLLWWKINVRFVCWPPFSNTLVRHKIYWDWHIEIIHWLIRQEVIIIFCGMCARRSGGFDFVTQFRSRIRYVHVKWAPMNWYVLWFVLIENESCRFFSPANNTHKKNVCVYFNRN